MTTYTIAMHGAKILAVLENGQRFPAQAEVEFVDGCRLTNRTGRGRIIVAVGCQENPIVDHKGRRWNFAVLN